MAKMGGKEAEQAVPVLVELLKPTFREYAPGGPRYGQEIDPKFSLTPYYMHVGDLEVIAALGVSGAKARPALPVLRATLQHPNESYQKAAEEAIKLINK